MTELFNKAIEAASKLSPEEQDALARELLERSSGDGKWERLFADPRSEKLLERLAAEADAEEAAGRCTTSIRRIVPSDDIPDDEALLETL